MKLLDKLKSKKVICTIEMSQKILNLKPLVIKGKHIWAGKQKILKQPTISKSFAKECHPGRGRSRLFDCIAAGIRRFR